MIRKEVKEEAELIVYEGGEIPEVAYWNAWFYLTESPPKGLGLVLDKEEELVLKKAVIRRYMFIIQRDLTPKYIGKSFYRGPVRARINWYRLRKFLERYAFSLNGYRERIKELIENFLSELPEEHPLYSEALRFKEDLGREKNE